MCRPLVGHASKIVSILLSKLSDYPNTHCATVTNSVAMATILKVYLCSQNSGLGHVPMYNNADTEGVLS